MPASVRAIANGFGTPSHNLALVLVVLVAAGALAFVLKIGWLYLVVFVLMLVWYVLTTRPTAQPGRSIEATLVAEQIVALGIASLIFHVALAGFDLQAAWVATKKFNGDSIWSAAGLFGEGLICATVAPLAAIWVRTANLQGVGAAVEPDRELHSLSTPVEHAGAAIVGDAARAIAANIGRYDEALSKLVSATDAFTTQLQESSTSTATAFSTTRATFERRIDELSASFDDAVLSMERRMAAFSSAIGALSSKLENIASPVSESFVALADEVRHGGIVIQQGLDEAAKDVRSAGKTLADDFRIVAAGFGDHGRALSRALEGVPEAVEARTTEISKHIDPLIKRLTALEATFATTDAAAHGLARDLPKLFESSAAAVAPLNVEMAALGEKMREGAVLLQGLQDLIGAVRRFIPADASPHDSAPTRSI